MLIAVIRCPNETATYLIIAALVIGAGLFAFVSFTLLLRRKRRMGRSD
jgi:hypothetical protein